MFLGNWTKRLIIGINVDAPNISSKKLITSYTKSAKGVWDKTDKTYQELLNSTLNIAIRDYKDRVNKTHTFDTNILANFQNSGGLKGAKGVKGADE